MEKRYWKRMGNGAIEARAIDYLDRLNMRIIVSRVGKRFVIENSKVGSDKVSSCNRQYERQIDAVTDCGMCFRLRRW